MSVDRARPQRKLINTHEYVECDDHGQAGGKLFRVNERFSAPATHPDCAGGTHKQPGLFAGSPLRTGKPTSRAHAKRLYCSQARIRRNKVSLC
jgi:hypothetical protein